MTKIQLFEGTIILLLLKFHPNWFIGPVKGISGLIMIVKMLLVQCWCAIVLANLTHD